MRKPLKKYRVTVLRVEREHGVIEVEAENEKRARNKAAYKASNGYCTNWREISFDVEAPYVEEVLP